MTVDVDRGVGEAGEAGAATDADTAVLTSPRITLAHQLCRRVLRTVQAVDDGAAITSVSRWDHDDSTLVRIRTGTVQSPPSAIVEALTRAWPLARVSLVENVIEGTSEAQMLMPSVAEQHDLARQRAFEVPAARRLRLCALLVFLSAVATFAALVGAAVAT